jgi:hypothetical protein
VVRDVDRQAPLVLTNRRRTIWATSNNYRGAAQPTVGRRLTNVPVWTGTVFTAFVSDVYSRRIVGWRCAFADDHPAPARRLEMVLPDDDRLVASVLLLQSGHPGTFVHVATSDIKLQNKLGAAGPPFVEPLNPGATVGRGSGQ